MPPAGVGDPGSTLSLLGDRGGDMGIEDRIAGVAQPAVNRRQTTFATAPQLEAMLGKLDSAGDRAMWATALYAGLRRGELTAPPSRGR